ncbi:DUF6057 family protein [Tangfeifania diversioriginum]|nr:DUF6057 family protein [Tangfeifania diversioriginum]
MNRTLKNPGFYIINLLFFATAFSYFFGIANHILFFQENNHLFIFSKFYLDDYFTQPGGLLVLTGKFFTQFYFHAIIGVIILATTLTLPAILIYHINKHLLPHSQLSLPLMIIPPFLLLLMQTHYYHMLEFNFGFLLILFFFYIYLTFLKNKTSYVPLILFPLVYYFIGVYAWILIMMLILLNLFYKKGNERFINSSILLGVAVITVIFSKKVLFFQPFEQLITYPFPSVENKNHHLFLYITTGFIAVYPLITKALTTFRTKLHQSKFIGTAAVVVIFGFSIFSLFNSYNNQTSRVIQLEKMVLDEEYNQAINFHEKYPSQNLIAQYFYNIALSETDQLASRLFYGRQDFNVNALILPWNEEHLNWGAHFFYTVGLINEAHRWAYEEMIVYGYRPQNISLLAKTNIINGNYKRAYKYVDILKNTAFYRDRGNEYEELLADTTLIAVHPEFGLKRNIMPQDDFFTEIVSPQNNIPKLLQSNPENQKAFEYMMAWFLLSKNVEGIINNLPKLNNLNYNKIPRHIEEATLAYTNSTGENPDLGGLTISNETILRFNQYISDFKQTRQNPSTQKNIMQNKYQNTFWFYFHFK